MKTSRSIGSCVVFAAGVASAQHTDLGDRLVDGLLRSPVQRGPVLPDWSERGGDPGAHGATYPDVFRTIDGWANNPDHPDWGSAGVTLKRSSGPAYPDGHGAVPARADGPSPRLVSNAIAGQRSLRPNSAGASDFLWQWGQFLDHDIVETPIADPAEPMDIPVPRGDIYFDPQGTGVQTIAFNRSAYETPVGVREQLNNITAYIDASMVYGSEHGRADELRVFDGTGRLKTSEGGLLPFNVNGFDNAPTAHDPSYFLAGDIRANEQVGLTAMHTLFVREHNRWAAQIASQHPGMGGDEIYERARAMVAAEVQAITYNEFLPLLLGPDSIPPYRGYEPMANAGISNGFATAAYRVGHTMLSSTIRRLGADGFAIDAGHLPLANAFFAPREIVDHGIDPVLRGLASQRAQEIDEMVIDDVRNFLFGPPGAGGFDLASLNIQRGRDHGLPGYNAIRAAHGLPPVSTFAQFTPDADLAGRLASLYGGVDDMDPWVALLAEPQAPGAMVGPTLRTILADQFRRLRDGDRFWYQSYLPPALRATIERNTLAEIIRMNTGIGPELPGDVFRVDACRADVTGDGVLDLLDVQAFVAAFQAGDPPADMTLDGVHDLQDLLHFIAEFTLGCP